MKYYYYVVYNDGSKQEVTKEVLQEMIHKFGWVARKIENDIYVFNQ